LDRGGLTAKEPEKGNPWVFAKASHKAMSMPAEAMRKMPV
jgi:hypothetical protein